MTETTKTILFWPCGPVIKYGQTVLTIEDLNPQVKLTWRVSRLELAALALRALVAAVMP